MSFWPKTNEGIGKYVEICFLVHSAAGWSLGCRLTGKMLVLILLRPRRRSDWPGVICRSDWPKVRVRTCTHQAMRVGDCLGCVNNRFGSSLVTLSCYMFPSCCWGLSVG